jgi:ABC-type bacteriocin/lantibiotic exporter with double-glycine peptidase domain
LTLTGFLRQPRDIPRTGDDTPASSVLRFTWRMTGWHQAFACGLAIVVTLLNLAPLELQRRIVNEVVETQKVSLLLQLGAIYVLLVLLHQAAKLGLRIYQGWLTESAVLYVRNHLIRLYGSEEKIRNESGRTVSIVGSEVEKLGGFVGEALSQACSNAAMLLGVSAYMLVVEPKIALFALAVIVPQVILTPIIQRRLNALVEERVGLMRNLADEISDFDDRSRDKSLSVVPKIYENRVKFVLLKFAMKALLNLLNAIGPITVLLLGGYLVMIGQTQVGVIVAFLSGFDRMSSPIRELIAFYRTAAQASVQHRLVAKWMSTN